MARLSDYEIREGHDGNVGIYLRKYNVRLATFAANSDDLQDLFKGLIWDDGETARDQSQGGED